MFHTDVTNLKYLYLSMESIFFGAPYITRRKRIPFVTMSCEEESIFVNTSAQSIKSLRFSNNLNTAVLPLLKMADVVSQQFIACKSKI